MSDIVVLVERLVSLVEAIWALPELSAFLQELNLVLHGTPSASAGASSSAPTSPPVSSPNPSFASASSGEGGAIRMPAAIK